MLGALTLISLRQLSQHKLRLALTVLGISLGVAVVFAVQTANTTLLGSLRRTVERIAGKATLQVSGGEAGFSQDYLETVKKTRGVRIAEPVIETVARTASKEEEHLLILGLDTTSNLELHADISDENNISVSNPLVFINRADSIAVSRAFAKRRGLKEGDALSLYTEHGKQDFIVRGFFKPVGVGEVFGGNIAVLDIYAAQQVFGRGDRFDRIDIMTDPEVPIETVQEALQAKLPQGLTVSRPTQRGQGLENAVSSVYVGRTIMSFLSLTVGVFIIFNSFSISVNQRWKEIGILRALGVESGNVQKMFLGEAVVIGVVGSVVGVALGFYLALAATKILGNVTASLYSIVTIPEQPRFRFDYAAIAFGIGVLASLIGAWLPARAASKLNPVSALHNIETRQRESIIGVPRLLFGFTLIIVGLTLTRLSTPRVGLIIQCLYALLVQLGMIVILPKLIAWGAFLLRPVMDRLFGAEGVIAVDTVARSPRRTSATVGALMLGLAFVFSIGTLIQSQKSALYRSLDRAVNTDIVIKSSDQIRSRDYHLNEDTARRIASLNGVQRAENLRVTTVSYGGEDVAIIAHDIDAWLTRAPDVLDEGNVQTARELGARGEGFIVSQNFAVRFGAKLNDTLTLETPTGTLSRPVLGILEYYQSEKGTIFLDRKLYKQFWQDNAIDYIMLTLNPDVNRQSFKSEIEKAIAGEQRAFIYTQEEYKNWAMQMIDQFFTISYLQMVIAIFVGALGLVNTLVISIADRRREIGVLRAIGVLRGQVRKMILLEAISISLIGFATGILSGLFNAYFLVHTIAVVIAGFKLPLRFPLPILLFALPVIIIVAITSAWFPARHAARLRVVEAIGYE